MTMEMWSLGFSVSPLRLSLLIVVLIPLLIRLSYHVGFEPTFDWRNDVVDAVVATGVGFATAAGLLLLFGILERGMSRGAVIGMVALQAVPASMGAMLAQSLLLGKSDESAPERSTGYWDELFHMGAGALFLAFNVAPTEEILLVAFRLPALHALALPLLSLLLMHAFVYAVEFRGESEIPAGTPQWSVFVRFTITGYALALAVSAYVLWTLGRTDGLALTEAVVLILVLGVPAAIGAASARLVL